MNSQVPWHIRYSVVPSLIMAALILAVVLTERGLLSSMTLVWLMLSLAPAYMAALAWNSIRVIKYEQRS
ncbi:hypothetical protein CGERO_00080 [Corynebacterium gerontici]|uniref:Uncharacterized protein n=1 Tax=Corynebacterium gerontici TaxID=2079234 RepID=A0A3G6IX69_9CORY|nr:hypothetical protein CGERO_00080 [Corynebacterium gerontici]